MPLEGLRAELRAVIAAEIMTAKWFRRELRLIAQMCTRDDSPPLVAVQGVVGSREFEREFEKPKTRRIGIRHSARRVTNFVKLKTGMDQLRLHCSLRAGCPPVRSSP